MDNQQFDEKTMPNQFLCPILQQVMKDPVVTVDGFTFERKGISEWLKRNNTNPLTNKPLASKQLVENRALRNVIEHHNTRLREIERQTNENTQKLIRKQNEIFASIYPELVNDCGSLDLDKFSIYSNETFHIRNILLNVKQKFVQLKKCCDKDVKNCKQCKSLVDAIKVYKGFLEKQIEQTVKMGSIVEAKQVLPERVEFLMINTEIIRGIDYRRTKRDQLKKSQVKGIMLTVLTLQQILSRIRKLCKIPQNDFVRIWITNYQMTALYDHIIEQVETITGSYLCKVKCIGRKIETLKKKYNELGIREDEFLIIEHGPGEQFIFRDDSAKCDYCYKVKKIEADCECKKVFYCSTECKTKDKTYHDNICRLQRKDL